MFFKGLVCRLKGHRWLEHRWYEDAGYPVHVQTSQTCERCEAWEETWNIYGEARRG